MMRKKGETAAFIYNLLARKPSSWSDLLLATSLSEPGLYKHLSALIAKGWVEKNESCLYEVTPIYKWHEMTERLKGRIERIMELALTAPAYHTPGFEVYGYLDELERTLSKVERELEERSRERAARVPR